MAILEFNNGGQIQVPLKPHHLKAAIAVDCLNLLLATVNGKVVEIVCCDAIHICEGIRLDTAKARAIGVDLALSVVMIKVDAPAIGSYHTHVEG